MIVALLWLAGCGKGGRVSGKSGDEAEMKEMYIEATRQASTGNFHASDSIGRELYNRADMVGNDLYRIAGLLSMSYSRQDDADRRRRFEYLVKAEELLPGADNDSMATRLYNFMGVCSMDSFEQAKHYFTLAMEAGRRSREKERVIMAECNLSEIYRLSLDTLGNRYDLDIYRFAKETDNEVMLRSAAVRCVEYYIRKGDLQKAVSFIEEFNKRENGFYYNYLRSKYLFAADSLTQAIVHWKKAQSEGIATPGYYLTGGKLYQEAADYAYSDSLLREADSGYSKIAPFNPERVDILRLRAINLNRTGQQEEAFRFMSKYAEARDSLSRVSNRAQINAFKVKFDTDKKEAQIAAQIQEIRSRNKLLGSVILFFLLIMAAMVLYLRKRNRMFRLMAAREKEFINRLDVYSPYIMGSQPDTELEQKPSSPAEQEGVEETADDKEEIKSVSGMPSHDKADAIWRSILHEMEHNRIYAAPDVTRDMFADRVGTNHTWFSAIIKDRTGKTYIQFMNSWRINEAVRILSAEECPYTNRELAAHLGFMTPQSFYAAFKSQMGMSPARFRQSNQ